jgi:hypothetical protein
MRRHLAVAYVLSTAGTGVIKMRGGRTLAVTTSIAAVLAVRYAAGRREEDKQTTAELDSRLANIGDVRRLSILPLVERPTATHNEMDAHAMIAAAGPGWSRCPGHDSPQWTLDAFAQTFGDGYRTLRVGEELVIEATG